MSLAGENNELSDRILSSETLLGKVKFSASEKAEYEAASVDFAALCEDRMYG